MVRDLKPHPAVRSGTWIRDLDQGPGSWTWIRDHDQGPGSATRRWAWKWSSHSVVDNLKSTTGLFRGSLSTQKNTWNLHRGKKKKHVWDLNQKRKTSNCRFPRLDDVSCGNLNLTVRDQLDWIIIWPIIISVIIFTTKPQLNKPRNRLSKLKHNVKLRTTKEDTRNKTFHGWRIMNKLSKII